MRASLVSIDSTSQREAGAEFGYRIRLYMAVSIDSTSQREAGSKIFFQEDDDDDKFPLIPLPRGKRGIR